MRNSRKRRTLPRAEPQKRLNRDGPSLSRFDACGALASPAFRLFDSLPRESRSAACSDRRVRCVGHNALVTDQCCHVERRLGPAVTMDARSVNVAMDCRRQPTIKAPRSTIKFAQVRAYL